MQFDLETLEQRCGDVRLKLTDGYLNFRGYTDFVAIELKRRAGERVRLGYYSLLHKLKERYSKLD
ncbi:hypothetical protein COV16_07175 [Candidatus Woesearchaeota archaeon CG10_big_fil_rev_8_21_14_0_10_34_8]|nr:MAG: hypothetical protein COV16_07175 [Candidatus Woesearchaeota archaeon CG10_big_fil_rev_8_21_14_0_10_34_8]